MAKEPKYTDQEKDIIKVSLLSWCTYEEIANNIWRTKTWVAIISRKMKYISNCPLCYNIRWNWKIYCKNCSSIMKKNYQKKWYNKNKDWYKNYRYNKYRFWWNYENVLNRDGYKCKKCWMENNEHIEKWWVSITVDHIDWKWRNTIIKNNSMDNLQTLCLKCHWEKDAKRTKHYLNANK